MLKLIPPKLASDTVFKVCVGGVQDLDLKVRLHSIEPLIEASSVSYTANAPTGSLHTIAPQNNVGTVTGDELTSLYEEQMVGKKGSARHLYDLIKSRSRKCTLCGHHAAATLDHYLPKSRFPSLAVNPLNLVPCCRDCNTHKGRKLVTDAGSQTFHPYFDDFTGVQWLKAKVVSGEPPVILFYTELPLGFDLIYQNRVTTHMTKFHLATLFSSNAAEELVNISHSLIKLWGCKGEIGVREHLEDQAASRKDVHLNSWQTAMYAALAESSWFCSTGYSKIRLEQPSLD